MMPYFVITIVFVLSRILLLFTGMEYQWEELITGMQIIDPLLLKHHLLQSIFYLHSQPPLFNLYIGIILKLFPAHFVGAFQFLSLLGSYSLGVALYMLMCSLSVRRSVALVLTCFFLLNPGLMLLEGWLMYSHFVIAVLCWTAFFIQKYLRNGRILDGLCVFVLMSILVLTHGVFHLCWFLIFMGLIMAVKRHMWKQVLWVSMGPLLLILALYAKNFVLFGSFTASRVWMAYNLMEMASKNVPVHLIRKYCLEGVVSPLACSQVLRHHQQEYQDMQAAWEKELQVPRYNIPILDMNRKPSVNLESWHSGRNLRITDYLLNDAVTFLRLHPQGYIKTLMRAYAMMFYPAPTDLEFINRDKISRYENWYNFMFAYQNHLSGGNLYSRELLLWYEFETMRRDLLSFNLYFAVVLFYLGLVGSGVYILYRGWRNPPRDQVYLGTLFFMLFNIIYIPFMSNFFAWIGSNRYRFITEPFNLVILGIILTWFLDKKRCLYNKSNPKIMSKVSQSIFKINKINKNK